MAERGAVREKRMEAMVFIFLAFILWPLLSMIFIGGYGFVVWMHDLWFGPPPLI
jgi:periplasmic nitrate reductase NapE